MAIDIVSAVNRGTQGQEPDKPKTPAPPAMASEKSQNNPTYHLARKARYTFPDKSDDM
jgi:hypothetical protein